MNTIKACFVSLYAYPLFNPHAAGRIGGAEMQLYYMAHGLAGDERFSVHFLTGDCGQPSFEARDGVGIYAFFNPTGRFKYVRSVWGAYRLMQLLRNVNPHICLVRAPGFEAGLTALFCVLFHKKLVYMASQHFEPERRKNYGMHLVRWMIFKWVLRSADLVLSQHEDQQKQLQDYFGKDSVVRRNAYPVSHDRVLDADHKNTVLWVGRCDAWKRPELFIELARLFPSTPFVMVCPWSGDDVYFNRIKIQAGWVHNLQFVSPIAFARIGPYFSRAMILVNTSISEGFPNTFLQALDARTPLLSFTADPGGVIEKYGLGYCAHDDFEQLKNDAHTLLNAADLREQMGERGYRYVAEHHTLGEIQSADRELVYAVAHARKDKPIIMEFLHYGVGGGLACLVNFASLFLLTEKAGFHYLLSAMISYPLAFLVGFLFQARITFKHTDRLLQKMIWFFFHQTIGFGLFIALMYGSTGLLGIYYLVSFVISAGMVYIFNFSFSKLFVFRSDRSCV